MNILYVLLNQISRYELLHKIAYATEARKRPVSLESFVGKRMTRIFHCL